jgi:hypothetical protein
MKNLLKLLPQFAYELVDHCEIKNGKVYLSEENLRLVVSSYLYYEDMPIFRFPAWSNWDAFIDDSIIWAITENFIQEEAVSELKRKLTDIELNRLCSIWLEDEKVDWNRLVLVREAIKRITSNPKKWLEVDEDYLISKKRKEKNENTNK